MSEEKKAGDSISVTIGDVSGGSQVAVGQNVAQSQTQHPPPVETDRAQGSVPEIKSANNAQVAKDSNPTSAIFISYRRQDSSDVTGRIYDRLIQHFGKPSVFKDVDSIPLGADFRKHLDDSVAQCDVLLTVIGRQWLVGDVGQRRLNDVGDFVRIEIEAALRRNIPIVPVLVQGATIPRLEDLPETLQALVYRNGIPVRPDPDFHQDMDRLIRGIEGHLEKKSNYVLDSFDPPK
jgi:TIR domain-containing protein